MSWTCKTNTRQRNHNLKLTCAGDHSNITSHIIRRPCLVEGPGWSGIGFIQYIWAYCPVHTFEVKRGEGGPFSLRYPKPPYIGWTRYCTSVQKTISHDSFSLCDWEISYPLTAAPVIISQGSPKIHRSSGRPDSPEEAKCSQSMILYLKKLSSLFVCLSICIMQQ